MQISATCEGAALAGATDAGASEAGGSEAGAVYILYLGIERLRLLGECLPGLPVAVAGDLTIVAKSGGFGDEDTLVRVARMIGRGR